MLYRRPHSILHVILLAIFTYDSEENLRAALVRMGVSSRAVEDVMDKVHNRHYQVIR